MTLTDHDREVLRDFLSRHPHPPWMVGDTARYYPREEERDDG